MLIRPRAGAFGLLVLGLVLVGAATAARAAGAQEDIDDPKVARRLKTRAAVALPAPVPAPASSTVTPTTAMPPMTTTPPTTTTTTTSPDPRLVSGPAAVAATAEPTAPADRTKSLDAASPTPAPVSPLLGPAGEDGIARKVKPSEHDDSSATFVPRLKLGYRRFSFVRIGATDAGSTTGVAASEPFDVVSLDLYPASSLVRFGLSTQYGAESGKLMGGGDYFIAESMSLGPQIPGNVFTPFAEGFIGGGYMRRMQFGSSVPTGYWHYGIDVGTEIFMSRYAFFSVAAGYLHPVNGFTKGLSFTSVYVDTWSLKLGIGL